MGRVKKIAIIYFCTILAGTVLSSLLLLGWEVSLVSLFLNGVRLSFLASISALLITYIAHWKLDHLDDYGYFRMMMRVLLGVLVATYLVLLGLEYVSLGDSELQRVYLVYSAIAVAATFLLLKPKKKSDIR